MYSMGLGSLTPILIAWFLFVCLFVVLFCHLVCVFLVSFLVL